LAFMIYAGGNVSGAHYNPAVTVGLIITKNCPVVDGLLYIVSQGVGSIIAGMLVYLYVDVSNLAKLSGTELEKATLNMNFCGCPHGLEFMKDETFAISQFLRGGGIEAASTFFLMFAIMGTAVDKRAAKSVYGFAIGATLAACIVSFGFATGGALNPWRHYGPIIGAGIFAPSEFQHMSLIYLFPFLGAIMAALLYGLLFMPKEGEDKPAKKAQELKETELLNE